MTREIPADISATEKLLADGGYLSPRPLATAIYLALAMPKPLFLEGEAGVGKTEVAKTLAATLGRDLIRLQCWEGMDISAAAYEWDYPRQLLEAQLSRAGGMGGTGETDGTDKGDEGNGTEGRGGTGGMGGMGGTGGTDKGDGGSLRGRIWSEEFLLKRPLLRALEGSGDGSGVVLLIDELDRADEPFDAFLLEFLADFQLTVPEFGTIHAVADPIVILTSNRTREVHDAIKRRCLYHWVDYPDASREAEIVRLKAPEAGEALTAQIVAFVHRLRTVDLFKLPGVAETIDWAHALVRLNCEQLNAEAVENTLGALLKYQDDLAKIRGQKTSELLAE